MIINFSVENFGSIKDKQTLSFLADKSIHLEDYYIIEPIKGLRLNKLALIYGANASGKTTILKSLDFFREICTEPFDIRTDKFHFEPFLFDEETPRKNTKFELEFVQNGIRYCYYIELNKDCIVKEKLVNYNPNKAVVFERSTDEKKELTFIKFGSKIPKKKSLEDNIQFFTLWNNTVIAGFLKANIDNYELREVSNWIIHLNRVFYSNTNLENLSSLLIAGGYDKVNTNVKSKILKILNKADFNITDVLINHKKQSASSSLISSLKNDLSLKNNKLAQEIIETGEVVNVKTEFQHTINNKSFNLPYETESEGTKRYFELSGILYTLFTSELNIQSVDELESSLHPDLFRHFLLTYLVNSKNTSQLIVTTHNREILNSRDLFRDDVIWFTDKNDNAATELYSLADFDSSVVRDTSNVLNIYRSGKLGGVPNLGDYYIDLEDEE
ncbi:MAG: ATP-binding protein [Chryseobacterium sp.]|jgi:AAA15 family ATPase/GTPase|uniref:AAA family ATPase n=1 Tax=Chryseobacterium sp. TaxID=1871047 RepID=UPI0028259483|nr:ATP-binding protein [Chryseobacterium sp.]MDR2237740.1 ATP-binding protein [Chryseobacterium sp.]